MNYSAVFQAHPLAMFLLWAVAFDISKVLVRYFKHKPASVYFHGSAMTMATIVTLTYSIPLFIQFWQKAWAQSKPLGITHLVLAVIINLLLIVQILGGLSLKIKLLSTKHIDFELSKLGHRVLGWSLWFLVKAQILIGLLLYGNRTLLYVYIIFISFVVLGMIIMEVSYRLQPTFLLVSQRSNQLLSKDLQLQAPQIIKFLNNYPDNLEFKQKFPQAKILILENGVYQYEGFIHPGGNSVFSQIQNQEVCRYYHGGHSLINSNTFHSHSGFAFSFLADRFLGRLEQPDIIVKSRNKSVLLSFWELLQKIKINQNACVFKFRSSQLQIASYLPGVNWFGRYIMLSPRDEQSLAKEWRPYSLLLCLSDKRIEIRQNVESAFVQSIKGKNVLMPIVEHSPSDTFSLIIKNYPAGKVSSFLHNHSTLFFKITGPFGLGLRLKASSSGVLLLVCGGTGVLPFLDLLDFMLMKSMYSVTKKLKGTTAAEKLNVFNQNYEQTLKDLRIVLVCSFKSRQEFYGYSIIMMLNQVCNQFKLDFFRLHLRYSDQHAEEGVNLHSDFFSAEFFKNILPVSPQRAIISGPRQMVRQVKQQLLKGSLPAQRIQLL